MMFAFVWAISLCRRLRRLGFLVIFTHISRCGLQICRRLRRLRLWDREFPHLAMWATRMTSAFADKKFRESTAREGLGAWGAYRRPLSLLSNGRPNRRRNSVRFDHPRFADHTRQRKDLHRPRYRCSIGFEDLEGLKSLRARERATNYKEP